RLGGPEALMLLFGLSDVVRGVRRATPPEVPAGEAGVAGDDGHPARQLTLEVARVLLNPGRALVRIDETDVTAGAGEQSLRVAARLHQTGRERIAHRDRRRVGRRRLLDVRRG